MTDVSLESKVFKLVAEQLGVNQDQIKLESTFAGDLGADSLDIVELIMILEENFGIDIPDEKATEIRTVEDAIKFIRTATNNNS